MSGDLPTIESKLGGNVVVDGRRVVMFASNDYLGLASHPKVVARAHSALNEYGVGTGMNPGRALTRVHRQLIDKLGQFLACEDVMLFNSCTAANCGLIATVIGRDDDVVFSDQLNHASIIDGCRLARGKTVVYGHCDMEFLAHALEEASASGTRLVVSDGVFSMESDVAPLPLMLQLAGASDSLVALDESHALGILGRTGRGTAEFWGVDPHSFIQTGTFSKALGAGIGGYIAGPRDLIARLRHDARFYIFTSPMPAVCAAAALAALEIIQTSADLAERAKENARRLRRGLTELGFRVLGGDHHPSTPVLIGESEATRRLSDQLLLHGIFAPAVVFPVVPEGQARLRLQVSAAHTTVDIDRTVDAFESCAVR